MELLTTQYTTASRAIGFVYGEGKVMLSLNAMISEVARTEIPVLVLGESGTGKDAYASLIHRLSANCNLSLKKINCSGVEHSELLAQVNESIRNLSNQDSPGSLYLDNIQELDLGCQRVLLSHLPDVEGAGSKNEACPRLISSTSKILESEVEAGRFLRDLFFRLNGACLRLPPLRQRREDIPDLTEFFLKKHSSILKKNSLTLNSKAMQTLDAYHWPGNIRELENVIRKFVVLGDVQATLSDLRLTKSSDLKLPANGNSESLKVASRAASRQAERELIMRALERTRWNRKRAAQELQISYKSLLYKLKEIGLPNGEQKS